VALVFYAASQAGWPILKRSHAIVIVSLILLIFLLPLVAGSSLSVNVSTSKAEYSPGENVSISGKVLDNQNNPVLGAGVSIQVNDPQSQAVHIQLVYSDQSGSYSDFFILSETAPTGSYGVFVTASKNGFTNGMGQTHFTVISQASTTTTPSSPKCVIATATYGSELSPEVSLLRDFRDRDVLKTAAGSRFMLAFNSFYYSFSPQVAAFTSRHEPVRAGMRLLLYPLIAILSAAKGSFELMSMEPELAATISGIIASLGIGAVYLGPVLAAMQICVRPGWPLRRTAKLSAVAGICWLFVLFLGEVVGQADLLVAGTVGTVLSFLSLGAAMVSLTMVLLKSRVGK